MPKLSRALALCLLLLCVIGLAATLSRSQAEELTHRLWLPQVRNAPPPTIPPTIPAACATRFPLESDVIYGSRYGCANDTKIVTNTNDIALIPLCRYHYIVYYGWVGISVQYVGEEYLPEIGPSEVFSRTWQSVDDISRSYFYYGCEGLRPECPRPTPRPEVTPTRLPEPTMTPAP